MKFVWWTFNENRFAIIQLETNFRLLLITSSSPVWLRHLLTFEGGWKIMKFVWWTFNENRFAIIQLETNFRLLLITSSSPVRLRLTVFSSVSTRLGNFLYSSPFKFSEFSRGSIFDNKIFSNSSRVTYTAIIYENNEKMKKPRRKEPKIKRFRR